MLAELRDFCRFVTPVTGVKKVKLIIEQAVEANTCASCDERISSPWPLIRKRTIWTERPPFVNEI
jgi:hypothetical protein